MMRALAEFIMRGRWQAASVALLGTWFPLVTPATVSLVALRKGLWEGSLVFAWAVLPALVALWISDAGALMAYSTVAVMVVVLVTALCLRLSTSWAPALVVLVVVSALAALMSSWVVPDVAQALTGTLGEFAAPSEGTAEAGALFTEAASGIVAYLIALTSVIAVAIGRWWQALLYNPGGFQAEMHYLRLPPVVAVVCAGAVAWCLADSSGSLFWANVVGLPLVVAGIGLVHYAVKVNRLGLVTLVIFYVALIVVRQVLLGIAVLAVLDSFINIRSRYKSAQ